MAVSAAEHEFLPDETVSAGVMAIKSGIIVISLAALLFELVAFIWLLMKGSTLPLSRE